MPPVSCPRVWVICGSSYFSASADLFLFYSSSKIVPGFASAKNFMVRRLIRVIPLYWAATLIYAAKLSFQGRAPEWWQILYSLFFIPYPNARDLMRPVLGVGWTMNFEVFFYVILAFSLFMARGWRLPVIGAAMLLLMVLRWEGVVDLSGNGFEQAVYLLGDSFLMFFVLGALIAQFMNARALQVFAIFRSEVALLVVLAIVIFSPAAIADMELSAAGSTALSLVTCAVCVLLCVHAKPSTLWDESSFWRKAIVLAGTASYSTYLTHGFVMGPAARLINLLGIDMSIWFFAISMIVMCTLTGMAIYQYFEKPIVAKLNDRWRKKSKPVLTTAQAAR